MLFKSNSNYLDTPLFAMLTFSKGVLKDIKSKDIGIELECEGAVTLLEKPTQFWKTVEDGSLRAGAEFVLNLPISMADLPAALVDLTEITANFKLIGSIRTSTHIHKSVLRQTPRQVYNAVVAYYLVEELLIRTQGLDRKGNLFCLTMKDANTIFQWLKRSAKQESFFSHFSESSAKYSALNLCTVHKYGSMEFRFFEAMLRNYKPDDVQIAKWCVLLYDLVETASMIDMRKLLDMYDDLPVKTFLRKLFPRSEWVLQGLSSEALNELLHTNYDSLRSFVRYFQNIHGYYRTPEPFWDEDEDLSDVKPSSFKLKPFGSDMPDFGELNFPTTMPAAGWPDEDEQPASVLDNNF